MKTPEEQVLQLLVEKAWEERRHSTWQEVLGTDAPEQWLDDVMTDLAEKHDVVVEP